MNKTTRKTSWVLDSCCIFSSILLQDRQSDDCRVTISENITSLMLEILAQKGDFSVDI